MDKIWYFYAGVSLWVAMKDGLEPIEKAAITKRLNEKFSYSEESHLESLIEKFSQDFETEITNLAREMNHYAQLHRHSDELIRFARLAVMDDSKLTEHEEMAISEIELILK